MNVELRDKATQRGNAVALTNAHHGNINTICTGIKRRNGIGVGTPCVIMSMKLNPHVWITFSTKAYQMFNLVRRSDADRNWQANTLNPCVNDGIKDSQHVYQVAAKRIFSGETFIASSRPNTSYQWHSIGKHLIDAATVAEGTQLS